MRKYSIKTFLGSSPRSMSVRKRSGLWVLIAILILAIPWWSGCSRKSSGGKDAATVSPQMTAAIPVTVAPVLQKAIPVELKAIGTGEAYSTVSVKSMVNGEITRVNFVEGQDVKKGQLLFTIDPRSYIAVLGQSEANLARDLAQQKNARDQADRYAALYSQGIVPKETADQYRTTLDALDATLRADRAAIENTKVMLSYCSIYAPIDGRTGSLLIHQGNVVKANDTLAMVVINQISPIYVDFSVPEPYLPEIKKHIGSGAKLRVQASVPKEEGSAEEGTLSFVNNTVDATTGTILLKGTFANIRRRLWPGQFVNIVLRLSLQPNAIVVPTQAIQTTQNGQFVFVVKSDQTVESRQVFVGQALEGETIIGKGLQPGEVVVTDGQLRLVPGARVQIKNAASNPPPQPGGTPARAS